MWLYKNIKCRKINVEKQILFSNYANHDQNAKTMAIKTKIPKKT